MFTKVLYRYSFLYQRYISNISKFNIRAVNNNDINKFLQNNGINESNISKQKILFNDLIYKQYNDGSITPEIISSFISVSCLRNELEKRNISSLQSEEKQRELLLNALIYEKENKIKIYNNIQKKEDYKDNIDYNKCLQQDSTTVEPIKQENIYNINETKDILLKEDSIESSTIKNNSNTESKCETLSNTELLYKLKHKIIRLKNKMEIDIILESIDSKTECSIFKETIIIKYDKDDYTIKSIRMNIPPSITFKFYLTVTIGGYIGGKYLFYKLNNNSFSTLTLDKLYKNIHLLPKYYDHINKRYSIIFITPFILLGLLVWYTS